MTIRVAGGTASITADIPVFIGTTADMTGSGHFPDLGDRLFDFVFQPKKGDKGTLVFDLADPRKRTANSPIFYQYFWHKDKLIVQEGLHGRCLPRTYSLSLMGLIYMDPQVEHIYYAYWGAKFALPSKHVDIVNLLRFLEGKITIEVLDSRADKK